MSIFQINTIIDKITTQKDGGVKIALATQEINGKDTKTLFDLANNMAWVAIKETPMSENEIEVPNEVKEFKEAKSKSERLRAVLYVYFEQNKPTEDFDTFYKSQMEKFINSVKDKLN